MADGSAEQTGQDEAEFVEESDASLLDAGEKGALRSDPSYVVAVERYGRKVLVWPEGALEREVGS